jgi:hypothetical protein
MLTVRARRLLTSAITLAAALLCGPSMARADVVLDWNVTMLNALAGQGPFATARFAAITELAVFEAVNAITGGYEPYLGTIAAPAGASAEAAAAAAAHGVLKFYFPAKAAALDAALAASLLTVPDGTAKADGIATGQAAALAMIALRANDGSAVEAFYAPGPAVPGLWQPTPSCPAAGGTNLHWRGVTPFGVQNVEQFRAGPPPSLTDGTYVRDYNEVKALGAIDSALRTEDRSDVAHFFAMFAPATWSNSAARQIASAQRRSLSDNARALALLNMTLSDASVAVVETKYHYSFWRPETAIHAEDHDGNGKTDPNVPFVPFIVAPCFPSYPSAHGTVSAAAAEVLARVYGAAGHDITFANPGLPGVILHYTTLDSIVADVSDARVYGGIHFRFDQEAGVRQGERLGQYIFKTNLRVANP